MFTKLDLQGARERVEHLIRLLDADVVSADTYCRSNVSTERLERATTALFRALDVLTEIERLEGLCDPEPIGWQVTAFTGAITPLGADAVEEARR